MRLPTISARPIRALATAALLLSLLLVAGCAQRSAEVDELFGGADALDLVLDPASATTREAYRIDGMAGWSKSEEADPREWLHAYPIISGPVPVDDASAATLTNVLADEATYLFDVAKACEFLPGVALRYERAGLRVDVLLCFSCDELEVYRDDVEVGHEDFDPRRAELVRIAQRLFPDDEAIQKLEP